MDGNRRWAKSHGKSVKEGHEIGAERLVELADWCMDLGIKYLTVFAFSTENWNRDPKEVSDMMSLLRYYLKSKEENFNKKNISVRVIGSKDNVPQDISNSIAQIESNTRHNDKLHLVIAFNYGGKQEIIDATKRISELVRDGLLESLKINSEIFEKHLYYGEVPNPDLIIRTGDRMRLSNFLLWQAAYSELYFDKTLWPDFSKDLLINIINDFEKRERRYGR